MSILIVVKTFMMMM